MSACMGGFCDYREKCDAHINPDNRHPAERLCMKGREQPVPVRVYRSAKTGADRREADRRA